MYIFFKLRDLFIGVALLATTSVCYAEVSSKEEGVTRIVAIGDSITEGITKPEHQGHRNNIKGGWVARLNIKLSSQFGEGQFEVINEGKTGNTSFAIKKRLTRSLFEYQPDVVIFSVGTNDINSNWMILPGKIYVGKSAKDADNFESVVQLIFENIADKLPSSEVMIVGLTAPIKRYWAETPWGYTIKFPNQNKVNEFYEEYNQRLRKLSNEFGFLFVDVESLMPKDLENRWKFYADGIHLNDEGYDVMTDLIHENLLHLLRKNEQ